MSIGLGARKGASALDRTTYRPVFHRLGVQGDEERLEELLDSDPGIEIIDRIDGQLAELLKVMHPSRTLGGEVLASMVDEYLGAVPKRDHGVWVHYPWSRRLVHLLDEDEFVRVRTDRNRNKITAEEQRRLAGIRVGIIGLSVGRSAALTLAIERSCGELRLADHDGIDLSNLNRLQAGAHELGINKTISAARAIAEIDPFLKVDCYTEGVTRENLDHFFTREGRLDILIEECDGVDMKILARRKARELRVPVVMDTNDRGMIDVERFDLEPDRPLLHGLISHLDPEDAAKARTNEEKIPFLAPMAGLDDLSTRMKASMMEIGESVGTWPQLATGTMLGGALVGDVCRRIALGQFRASGRWYVDIEAQISDGPVDIVPTPGSQGGRHTHPGAADEGFEALIKLADRLDQKTSRRISVDEARGLAKAAALAPSADNMQPWKFLLHDGRFLLFHDRARSRSVLDPTHLIAHIALGMCVENILLEAGRSGLVLNHSLLPLGAQEDLMAAFWIGSGGQDGGHVQAGDLASQIAVRHTNRRKGRDRALRADVLEALAGVVRDIPGADMHFITAADDISQLASICGAADRLRIMNEHGHREFFQDQLRWTQEDAERTGDGLDVATLELSASDRVGLRMASSTAAIRMLAALGGGRALEKMTTDAVRSSAAIALVTMPDLKVTTRLLGGRAAERLWLGASEAGLAVHPISAPIFLAHHDRADGGGGFTEQERGEVRRLFNALCSLFGSTHAEPLFMVRLSLADEAGVRSLRRPLDRMFHVHDLPSA